MYNGLLIIELNAYKSHARILLVCNK